MVPAGKNETARLRDALLRNYSITAPTPKFLKMLVDHAVATPLLGELLDPARKADLQQYLWGLEIIDFLLEHPSAKFGPEEFVGLLSKLQPRLYSIASSQRVHPDEAHLMVLAVSYSSRGRERFGVGSTYINDRWPEITTAPVYVQDAQKHFAMPADPSTPMIMIGPGTGLAPFRGFLEERDAVGAAGKNWLFFGEQSRAWGFYYGPALADWQRRGLLRLDLAFSRDQPEKIYVQDRMRENTRDLYGWLEEGAEVFICGDKGKMAADVQRELVRIVETAGGRTPEQAAEYMAALKKSHRLKLDVY